MDLFGAIDVSVAALLGDGAVYDVEVLRGREEGGALGHCGCEGGLDELRLRLHGDGVL